MTPRFNIVLVMPEIPQNTGAIGRMCVSTDCRLHLIEPLGFELDEKHLLRAGMDYWPHLDLALYKSWEEFLERNPDAAGAMYFISTKGETAYWDTEYKPGDYLVFGRESAGLPPEFYDKYHDLLRIIPMPGSYHRSLNLANSVGIVMYEAMRQTR